MYLSRKKAKSCSCFPHKLNIRKGNSKEENEILRGYPDLDGFMAHTWVAEVKSAWRIANPNSLPILLPDTYISNQGNGKHDKDTR